MRPCWYVCRRKSESLSFLLKGYGDRGAGEKIPGGATLKFEVECLNIAASASGDPDIAPHDEIPNVFAEMDKDNSNTITPEEMQAWFAEQSAEIPEGLWETEDKDGDGIITFDEFGGPKGLPQDIEDESMPEEEHQAIEDFPDEGED